MRLTESQVSFFHDNGYLLLEDALDETDLGPVINEYSAIIAERAEKLQAEGKVSDTYTAKPFTERLLRLADEAQEVTANLDIMQARGEATFNFLKNPKILDIAGSLVGSEIVCNPIQHIRAVLPIKRSQRGPDPLASRRRGVLARYGSLLHANGLDSDCGCNLGKRMLASAAG